MIGAEHADHDREQHRNRDGPALIKRHQEQIGEQDRKRENDAGLSGGRLLLIGGAGPFEGIAGRQRRFRELRHRRDRGAGRHTRRRAAIDGHGAVVVVAGDDLRTGDDPQARDRAQRHHLARAVAHVDLPDVGNVGAVVGLALHVDLPGAAKQVEVVDVDAAQRRLQRGEDIADVEAERLRLGAIDVEIDRRIGRGEGREHARQPRIAVGGGDQAPASTLPSATGSCPSSASS